MYKLFFFSQVAFIKENFIHKSFVQLLIQIRERQGEKRDKLR